MKEKNKSVLLLVIGISTFLIATLGATYAWFNTSVEGNSNASSIYVTTANLGTVVFTDGAQISMQNIRPETSPSTTKTFYIANTDSTATEQIVYTIYLNVVTNTITPNAEGAFVYSLSGS